MKYNVAAHYTHGQGHQAEQQEHGHRQGEERQAHREQPPSLRTDNESFCRLFFARIFRDRMSLRCT